MPPIWMEARPVTFAFWAAYAGCFLPEIIGSFIQKAGGSDKRRDRGSEAVIIGGTGAALFLAFTASSLWPGLRISADEAAMLLAGTGLIVLGVAFRWYAIRVLGRFFTRSVAIREGHRIVRDGPYRYLRHPSYSGYLLAAFGIGVGLNNWASLALQVTINVAVYAYRIRIEEQALTAAFGAAYRDYQASTSRLIPFIY
jgi:protein-S-isoprenylcysteine O-methyltransferase